MRTTHAINNEYLRDLRKKKGLTQTQFASRMELSQGRISQMETRPSGMSTHTIWKIVTVLEMNPHEVVKLLDVPDFGDCHLTPAQPRREYWG